MSSEYTRSWFLVKLHICLIICMVPDIKKIEYLLTSKAEEHKKLSPKRTSYLVNKYKCSVEGIFKVSGFTP